MTRIINIAGTSGSGKSTVVRRLLEVSTHGQTLIAMSKEIGRIVYLGEQSIFIAGRYGAKDTSGCDCVKDVAFWYETIYKQAEFHHVVYEGLFVMNHERGLGLMNKLYLDTTMHVINLTTPFEVCIASINERRARRGQPVFTGDMNNLKSHVTRATNFAFKLRQLGAQVYNLDREAAVVKLKELVG